MALRMWRCPGLRSHDMSSNLTWYQWPSHHISKVITDCFVTSLCACNWALEIYQSQLTVAYILDSAVACVVSVVAAVCSWWWLLVVSMSVARGSCTPLLAIPNPLTSILGFDHQLFSNHVPTNQPFWSTIGCQLSMSTSGLHLELQV